MLAFFTAPYPNELLISAITRYHHYIDNRKHRITNYELFGREEVSGYGYYSLGLDYLVKKLGGTYSSEELINNHTIYPFHNRDVKYYSRYMGIRKQLSFCPECARLDIEKYGETYFHREHQLDGISICPKHKIVLKKYGNGITWNDISDYYKMFDSRNVDLNNFQILDDSKYDKYWQISKLSYDLLSCNQNHQLNWWYAPALKGHITGTASQDALNSSANRITITGSH